MVSLDRSRLSPTLLSSLLTTLPSSLSSPLPPPFFLVKLNKGAFCLGLMKSWCWTTPEFPFDSLNVFSWNVETPFAWLFKILQLHLRVSILESCICLVVLYSSLPLSNLTRHLSKEQCNFAFMQVVWTLGISAISSSEISEGLVSRETYFLFYLEL